MGKPKNREKDGRFKPAHKAKFHVLSYRLNDEEYCQLKEISHKTGDFISTLTRMAIRSFLAKAPK